MAGIPDSQLFDHGDSSYTSSTIYPESSRSHSNLSAVLNNPFPGKNGTAKKADPSQVDLGSKSGTLESAEKSALTTRIANPLEVSETLRARAAESFQRAQCDQQPGAVSPSNYPTGLYFIPHCFRSVLAFGVSSDVLSPLQTRRAALVKGFEPTLVNGRPALVKYNPREGTDPEKVQMRGSVAHIQEHEDAAYLGVCTGVRCWPVPIDIPYDDDMEPLTDSGWILVYDRGRNASQDHGNVPITR